MTYRKFDVRFSFGFWTKLGITTRDIKILYIHNAIDKLIATVRKDNIHKYYTFACIAF